MTSETSESRWQIEFTLKLPAVLQLYVIDQNKGKQFFLNFISERVRKHLMVIKVCRHEKVRPDIDCLSPEYQFLCRDRSLGTKLETMGL